MGKSLIQGKELKNTILNVLVRFDEFCKRNDIKYSIAYGTALGAIRHKGFIPWDDDIDVIMLRSEYKKFEKLWKLYAQSNTDDYKLWAEMDEENYFMAFCAKFFDTRTVLYERFTEKKVVEYGVYIDIFVLDHIPVDKEAQIAVFRKIHVYWKWIQHFQRHFKAWNYFVRKYKLPLPSLDLVANRLMNLKNKYNNQTTPYVSLTQDYKKKTGHNKSIYKYEWFNDFILVDFEGCEFPLLKEFDEMLKITYGDYMTLPPEEERIGHNIEAYWKE
jgi:lipopolysaccharide cholinephosphotransferase